MALRTLTDQQSVDVFASMSIPCSGTVIASGDYKSVDPAPTELTPPNNSCSLTVVIVFTAQSGAGNTLTTVIEGYDKASNTWVTLAAPAADATGGAHTKVYRINPYVTTADPVFGANLFEVIRVRPVGSGTRTTLNYSIGAHFSA